MKIRINVVNVSTLMNSLIVIMFMVLLHSCCVLYRLSNVESINKTDQMKLELLDAVIKYPNNLQKIIVNSDFYSENRCKYLIEKIEEREIDNIIKDHFQTGYEIVINKKYELTLDIDSVAYVNEIIIVSLSDETYLKFTYVFENYKWYLTSIAKVFENEL